MTVTDARPQSRRDLVRLLRKGVVLGVVLAIAIPVGVGLAWAGWLHWREIPPYEPLPDEKMLKGILLGNLSRKCSVQTDHTTECDYAIAGLDLKLSRVGRTDAGFRIGGEMKTYRARFDANRRCAGISFVEWPWVTVYVSPNTGDAFDESYKCEAASVTPEGERASPKRPQARRGRPPP